MREGFLATFLFHKFGPPRYRGDLFSLSGAWLRQLIELATEESCVFVNWDRLLSGQLDDHDRFVTLTFDDGFESDVTQALPILQESSIPASFFIVPAFIGEPGHLSWNQVRALTEAGMTIGSHTLTHAWLPELSAKKLWEELEGSRQVIEDHIAAPVSLLSLPGGFYNQRVLETAWRAGYTIVSTTDYGVDRLDREGHERPWVLKRNTMDLRMSWDALRALLQGRVPRGLLAKNLKKHLIAGFVGPTRYRKLAYAWWQR
jgi:peptidoglycan/xylan/chitin deacetylase (PgdA/CDA1 family)